MFWWESRLIIGAQLECVSWAARCIWCDLHSWMWWHQKAWCQLMERKYWGRYSKKDDAWVSSWKQEEQKWMKDDMVTYSKCFRGNRMGKTVRTQLSNLCSQGIVDVKRITRVCFVEGCANWIRISSSDISRSRRRITWKNDDTSYSSRSRRTDRS